MKGKENNLRICEFCSKSFSRAFNLKRHIASYHRSTDETEYFICAECEKQFKRKDSLVKHVQSHFDEENVFECATCRRCLPSKRTLLQHLRKQHGFILTDEFVAECKDCSFKSRYKRNIKRHIHTVHSPGEEKYLRKKTSQLKCLQCNLSFPSKNTLIKHYSQDHNIELEIEYLNFASIEEFEKWKSPHYRRTNKWKTPLDFVWKYKCHRSGTYEDACKKSGRKRKRHLKLAGSKKLQGICPAEINVRQRRSDGLCVVTHQKVHIGHDINDISELCHVYLPKGQKNNRLDVLNVKDIHNISTEYEVRDPFSMHNDSAYVDAFVTQNRDSILFYKKQNETDMVYNIFDDNDFILIVQDEFQKESLLKYGQKLVAFSGTRGIHPFNYVLHSMLVLNAENEDIPVAFLISNRNDSTIIDLFITYIRECAGIIQTKTLMTDMDLMYSESWRNIMGAPQFSLFCTLHVREVWKHNLNKLITISGQERRQIISDIKWKLKDLADDLNEISFLTKLTSFLSQSDPAVQPFIDYFRENYTNNTQSWALCYQIHAGANLNIHVKTFHRILKYKIAKGKTIETLSSGLYCIEEYIKYRNSKNKMKIIRPVLTKKIRVLRKKHAEAEECAEKQPFIFAHSPDDRTWQVLSVVSDSIVEMNSIHENEIKECALYPEPCGLFCELCNSCSHQYSCSCHDSAVLSNMCKHIHSLSLFRKNGDLSKVDVITCPSNIVEELPKIIESPPDLVHTPIESTYDQKHDQETSLEKFHLNIEEQFLKVANAVKNFVTLENKEVWDKIFDQYLRPIIPALEAMQNKQ